MTFINIDTVRLRRVAMPLRTPFVTKFGRVEKKEFFVAELIDESGKSGWGESTAFVSPWYTEETTLTVEHMLIDFLIPLVKKEPFHEISDVEERFNSIRGNPMAKSILESALWDLYAKKEKISLATAFSKYSNQLKSNNSNDNHHDRVDVGVAVGLQPDMKDTLKAIEAHLMEGYQRIKLKITPEHDMKLLKEVRNAFPDITLMVDANSAYTIDDLHHLKYLDQFRLLMIEQPFSRRDFVNHAKLQKSIETPVCLDESIISLADVRTAHSLGSCTVINVKPSRVGGFCESLAIHNYCQSNNLDLWCGGMLETGIGRAQNIALASLNGFTLPGDLSGSDRYWEKDIITHPFKAANGKMDVPQGSGLGVDVDLNTLSDYTVWENYY